MKPYGVKRNWNEEEIYVKNGCAQRRGQHRKWQKLGHRKIGRITRQSLKKNPAE